MLYWAEVVTLKFKVWTLYLVIFWHCVHTTCPPPYLKLPPPPSPSIVRSCSRGDRGWRACCVAGECQLWGVSDTLSYTSPTCNPCGEQQREVGWQRSGQRPHEERPWDQEEGGLQVRLCLHLVRHRLLGVLPLPAPVDQGDEEERSPEDQVGHRDHQEHLHPRHSLLLHTSDVLLDVARGPDIEFLKENWFVMSIIHMFYPLLAIAACWSLLKTTRLSSPSICVWLIGIPWEFLINSQFLKEKGEIFDRMWEILFYLLTASTFFVVKSRCKRRNCGKRVLKEFPQFCIRHSCGKRKVIMKKAIKPFFNLTN